MSELPPLRDYTLTRGEPFELIFHPDNAWPSERRWQQREIAKSAFETLIDDPEFQDAASDGRDPRKQKTASVLILRPGAPAVLTKAAQTTAHVIFGPKDGEREEDIRQPLQRYDTVGRTVRAVLVEFIGNTAVPRSFIEVCRPWGDWDLPSRNAISLPPWGADKQKVLQTTTWRDPFGRTKNLADFLARSNSLDVMRLGKVPKSMLPQRFQSKLKPGLQVVYPLFNVLCRHVTVPAGVTDWVSDLDVDALPGMNMFENVWERHGNAKDGTLLVPRPYEFAFSDVSLAGPNMKCKVSNITLPVQAKLLEEKAGMASWAKRIHANPKLFSILFGTAFDSQVHYARFGDIGPFRGDRPNDGWERLAHELGETALLSAA